MLRHDSIWPPFVNVLAALLLWGLVLAAIFAWLFVENDAIREIATGAFAGGVIGAILLAWEVYREERREDLQRERDRALAKQIRIDADRHKDLRSAADYILNHLYPQIASLDKNVTLTEMIRSGKVVGDSRRHNRKAIEIYTSLSEERVRAANIVARVDSDDLTQLLHKSLSYAEQAFLDPANAEQIGLRKGASPSAAAVREVQRLSASLEAMLRTQSD